MSRLQLTKHKFNGDDIVVAHNDKNIKLTEINVNTSACSEINDYFDIDKTGLVESNGLPDAGTFNIPRANNSSTVWGKSVKSKLIDEQQLNFIKMMREGDARAKQKVITAHMYLVVDVARGYENRGVPIFDLIMEGSFGLIHALETFDLEGCVPFLDDAELHIRESIENVINIQKDPNHISVWQAYQQANEKSS